jgi:hypothetical protein
MFKAPGWYVSRLSLNRLFTILVEKRTREGQPTLGDPECEVDRKRTLEKIKAVTLVML